MRLLTGGLGTGRKRFSCNFATLLPALAISSCFWRRERLESAAFDELLVVFERSNKLSVESDEICVLVLTLLVLKTGKN
jgi:hypothetical protein